MKVPCNRYSFSEIPKVSRTNKQHKWGDHWGRREMGISSFPLYFCGKGGINMPE
jgi:hypothetical protein